VRCRPRPRGKSFLTTLAFEIALNTLRKNGKIFGECSNASILFDVLHSVVGGSGWWRVPCYVNRLTPVPSDPRSSIC
jgi:hypothetical protein